jgi:hypothetical protein
MKNGTTQGAWRELVDRAAARSIPDNYPLRRAASDDELSSLQAECAEAGLFVGSDYIEFLRYTNGFEYDGFLVYGAGGSDDLVDSNRGIAWREPEETYYGSADGLYLLRCADGKYRMIDGASGDPIYGPCDGFLDMVADQLMRMFAANEAFEVENRAD